MEERASDVWERMRRRRVGRRRSELQPDSGGAEGREVSSGSKSKDDESFNGVEARGERVDDVMEGDRGGGGGGGA